VACDVSIEGRHQNEDHLVYEILTSVGGNNIRVHRRYREFLALDESLRSAYPELPGLPPKSTLRIWAFNWFSDHREEALQNYLRVAVWRDELVHPALATFLAVTPQLQEPSAPMRSPVQYVPKVDRTAARRRLCWSVVRGSQTKPLMVKGKPFEYDLSNSHSTVDMGGGESDRSDDGVDAIAAETKDTARAVAAVGMPPQSFPMPFSFSMAAR
jgi:hypothetical protein